MYACFFRTASLSQAVVDHVWFAGQPLYLTECSLMRVRVDRLIESVYLSVLETSMPDWTLTTAGTPGMGCDPGATPMLLTASGLTATSVSWVGTTMLCLSAG